MLTSEQLKQKTELEFDIQDYEETIKLKPYDDNTHFLKARDSFKLGDITGDKSYYDKALNSYNKAIELSPNNGQYLVDRSKLHIAMKRPDLAAEDIIAAQKSPNMENKVLDMYKKQTMHNVLKLASVQSEVNNLIANGQLPEETAKIFSDMIQVISDISLSVSKHDERLDIHDEKFVQQEAKLKLIQTQLDELQKQYPILVQGTETISKEVTAIQTQLILFDQTVDQFKEQQSEISERLNEITQFRNTIDELKEKIKADSKVSTEDKEIMESRIDAIAAKMKNLANQDDVKIITIETAKLISETKITKGRLADLEDDIDNIIERQNSTDKRLEKLELFKQKADQMLEKLEVDSEISASDKKDIKDSINDIVEKMQNFAKQDDIETITIEMTNLINNAKFTKTKIIGLSSKVEALLEKQEISNNTTTNMVSEVTYDIPLLNHPTLFMDAAKHFGISKALDLSQLLSTQLAEEAIHNNDPELILAGLMSLSLNNSH